MIALNYMKGLKEIVIIIIKKKNQLKQKNGRTVLCRFL